MRELHELCQCNGFELGLPKPTKADGEFHVKVEVNINGKMISCTTANRNSKDARKLAAQDALSKLKVYLFWQSAVKQKLHVSLAPSFSIVLLYFIT